jgi:hypothetical protein
MRGHKKHSSISGIDQGLTYPNERVAYSPKLLTNYPMIIETNLLKPIA